MDWYILPAVKKVCLTCHLPMCNEDAPGCPHRLAKKAAAGKAKGPTVRERQVLAHLDSRPDTWFRVRDVVMALKPIPAGTTTGALLKLRREGRVIETGQGRALRLRIAEKVAGDL